MLQWVIRFFSAPPGKNRAATVRTRLLSRVLNVHLLIALSIAIFYPDDTSARRAIGGVALGLFPMGLVLRVLLHRGLVKVASWIFLIVLSATTTALSMILAGTMALLSTAVVQMTTLIMGGLLLGPTEAILFAIATVAVNAWLFSLEARRLPERAAGLEGAFILQAIFYIAAAVLLARAVSLASEALDLAAREATERIAVEAQLRESVERYRLITTVSSDYVFSTLLAAGRLELNWVAGAFEKITGYAYDEYVRRGGWRAALHPDDVAQDENDLALLRENRPVVSELRTIRKDGSICWVRIYAHPVWDEKANTVVGIYGAVQDIGDRKKAEAEREAVIHELEARNAELERFTYTVSHDLKSPLITIRGFLGHVGQAAVEGRLDDVRADMDRIYKSTAKMHKLLDDLLELSRIGRLAKAPEDASFEAIVRDALDRTHGRLTARGITVEVSENLPTVSVDRDRMVEVVQNLVDNASKFMGDQPDPLIRIGVRRDKDERVFFVQDNGIGIDPRHHERVFSLFDKLDARSPGTGVGLALTKRIVEVHGGRIWVESGGLGAGTTFAFTLDPSPPART